MSTRRFLIAANWKMNPPPDGWDAKDSPFRSQEKIDVVVFPTFLDIPRCLAAGLRVGAQYGHPDAKGSHTGDVSMTMLKTLGITHILCGHSERRRSHAETDEMVAAQAKAALALGLIPIVCIGETEQERQSGNMKEVIQRQLALIPSGVIIAYEPVWAIGNGKSATPAQTQEMHMFIRALLQSQDQQPILYGGSMNPQNAKELLSQPDINGGLIGAASLKPQDFAKVVETAIALS
jgi:triosephosphate isomerase